MTKDQGPRLSPELLELITLTLDVVAEQIMDARNASQLEGYFTIHIPIAQAERVISVSSAVSSLVEHYKNNKDKRS